jgi:hypothetical protein
MNDLTPKQQKKVQKIVDLLQKGETAIIEHLFEIEELVETSLAKVEEKLATLNLNSILEQVKGKDGKDSVIPGPKGDKGDKGDPGKDGTNGTNGKDGYTPVKDKDYFDGKDGESIVGPKGEDGKDGSPDTAEQVRDKLESLKEEARLDVKAIKGLDDFETKLVDSIVNRALEILDRRTQYLITKISNVQSQVDALGSSSGGLNIEDPTSGSINGSNTIFTFATVPSYLSIDDTNKFEGTDYTRVGTTVTITNGSPPVNSIKGIS